jgi:P-type Cu+ transporter
VSSWVTVAHDRSLSKQDIQDALASAGFDVCDITPDPSGKSHLGLDSEIGYLDRFLDRLESDKDINSKAEQPSRHLDNCESYRLQAGGNEVSDSNPPPIVENRGKKAISVAIDKKAPPLVVVDSGDSQDIWRASLAIGGMTCAACVVTITEELEKKDWIKKVAVNLLTNNATVDFIGEQHKNDVVESIEDIGYDAAIDSLTDLKKLQNASSESRSVQRGRSLF